MQTTYKIPNAPNSFLESLRGPIAPEALESRKRELRKAVAHHEAGHVAAHAFLGHDWSCIEFATIRPTREYNGLFRRYGLSIEYRMSFSPDALRYHLAELEGIALFAGPVSEEKFEGEQFYVGTRAENVVMIDDRYAGCEIDVAGTDLFKAATLADLTARRYHPKWTLMHRWADLAVEMMDIPEVWQCVETFAERLLEEETVHAEEIYEHFAPIEEGVHRFPRWQGRARRAGRRLERALRSSPMLSGSNQQ